MSTGTSARRRLTDAVLAQSHATAWDEAQLEWATVGRSYDYHGRGVCQCGQTGLKRLFTIENRVTGARLYPIGSTCIVEHFESPVMRDQLRIQEDLLDLEELIRTSGGRALDLKFDFTRSRILALLKAEIINRTQWRTLTELFNKRKTTVDDCVAAERLIREVVTPALGGPAVEIAELAEYHSAFQVGLSGGRLETRGTAVSIIGHHDGQSVAAAA